MTEAIGFDSRYWDGVLPEGTNYKFAGIKTSEDTNFIPDEPIRQWKRANRLYGLLRLPFHYWIGPGLLQNSHSHGRAQAQFMYDTLSEVFGGKYNGMGELPPALDLEDKTAPKGRRSIQSIKACLNRMEVLFDRKPIIYTAGWWFDEWIKPHFSPDKFGGWDIYSYDIWEADPGPDTPCGEWAKSDIVQYKLDIKVDGFNASIDKNRTTQSWIDKVVAAALPPEPPLPNCDELVQEAIKATTAEFTEKIEDLSRVHQADLLELRKAHVLVLEASTKKAHNDALKNLIGLIQPLLKQ